jgi:non-canonical purine NTP pyrophosphatase (RdgB/HAM1 family)
MEEKEEKYKKLAIEYDIIIKKISQLKPEFDKILKEIAKRNHAIALTVPLKSKKRTIEKALTEYEGNIMKVSDILRGSIISPVFKRCYDILNDIKREFEVVRIKDRLKKPEFGRYRFILVNVNFKGIIAEIQIQIKELFYVQNYFNHLLYEIYRIIIAQAKKENRNLYSWEEYIINEIKRIKEYSNIQATNRQEYIEKGIDPNKLIFVVTNNIEKYREIKSLLPTVKLIRMKIPEIQSNNIREVVKSKVLEVLKRIDARIIVEHVSLECDGLKGLPGPAFSLFDRINIKDFAKLVISTGNTNARAISTICFAESLSKLHFFTGIAKGRIVLPRGNNGFKWDPIFQPNGYKETYAEMPLEKKMQISMRRLALDKMVKFLHKKNFIV